MKLFGRQARPDRLVRSGTPFDLIVVGLGNPGTKYARTRHNVGQEAIQYLATEAGRKLRAGHDRALTAELTTSLGHYLLAIPTTFMNESGIAVAQLANRYAIDDPSKIIIVHDEMDFEPGTVRIKVGGSAAGHNGLRSVIGQLKTEQFVRIRIGIGKPDTSGVDHVLSRVPNDERELLDQGVRRAWEAIQLVMEKGLNTALQTINSK